MTKKPIRLRLTQNTGPCLVPYCGKGRHGTSHYCQAHKDRNRKYGHPTGRRLIPRDYAFHAAQVERLLREDPTHTGVSVASAFLDRWLEQSWRGAAHPARAQLARLFAHGVTGPRLLVELAAVWTYSEKSRVSLSDDQRLTFALANAAFHLAPRNVRRKSKAPSGRVAYTYERIPREDRLAAGEFIRKNLSPLLHNIATSISEGEEHEKLTELALARALSAPIGNKLRIPTHP